MTLPANASRTDTGNENVWARRLVTAALLASPLGGAVLCIVVSSWKAWDVAVIITASLTVLVGVFLQWEGRQRIRPWISTVAATGLWVACFFVITVLGSPAPGFHGGRIDLRPVVGSMALGWLGVVVALAAWVDRGRRPTAGSSPNSPHRPPRPPRELFGTGR
jgi:hypothetical protein